MSPAIISTLLWIAQFSCDGDQVGQVIIQVRFLLGQLLRKRLLQVTSIVPWQRLN